MKSAYPLAFIFMISAGLLHADPITGLFDTGVGSGGVPLANGTADPHYAVVASPGGPTSTVAGSLAGTWIGPDLTSQWISGLGQADTAGHIDFQTSFTLLAGGVSSTSITGQFATDNELVGIYLNGISLGISQPNQFGFEFWTPFLIPVGSDFVAGNNVLDFVINNDGGPEGLRVEMTGSTFPVSSVADTGSTCMLLCGAIVVFAAARRRLASS